MTGRQPAPDEVMAVLAESTGFPYGGVFRGETLLVLLLVDVVLADHLSSSDLTAGRILALLLPALIAAATAVLADAALPAGLAPAGRRRRIAVAGTAAAVFVLSALLLPDHERLADWIG